MSQRTIERDLRSLNEAGVPVYGIEGRTGGYTILPEHSMPPLRLTAQEAAACVAALALIDGSPLAPHARTALDKLRTTLPELIREIDAWDSSLLSVRIPLRFSGAIWLDAIRDRVLVELVYDGDDQARIVEPYTALQARGAWYLVGWCRTRNAVRGFRTDRLRDLKATPISFLPTHSHAVAEDLSRWETESLMDT